MLDGGGRWWTLPCSACHAGGHGFKSRTPRFQVVNSLRVSAALRSHATDARKPLSGKPVGPMRPGDASVRTRRLVRRLNPPVHQIWGSSQAVHDEQVPKTPLVAEGNGSPICRHVRIHECKDAGGVAE
jgi:hypothetical protein